MTRKDFSESISETIRLHAIDRAVGKGGSGAEPSGDTRRGAPDRKLVVFTGRDPMAAEYFHYLAVKVERSLPRRPEKSGKVILVTGPSRGSGKTICSLNLALALAKTHQGNVLFLDADSRAGQAQRYLGLGDEPLPGLSDVLEMNQRAGSILVNTGMFNMTFFPSGPYVDNLLTRTGDREIPVLFESLRRNFALTVVDTPPAFPLPEAGILAARSDAVLVVLEAGRDGATQLEQTLEAIRGAPVLGVVLNNMPDNVELARYGRYGGYSRYYAPGRGHERR